MRKIGTLFLASIICLIIGCCVFVFEVSNIEHVNVDLGTKRVLNRLTVEEGVKNLLINDVCEEDGSVFILTIEEDDSLKPNEVVFDMSEDFELNKRRGYSRDFERIVYFTKKTDVPVINRSLMENFDDLIEIWKNKKMDVLNYNSDYYRIHIRHGLNVCVIDMGSDDYVYYQQENTDEN